MQIIEINPVPGSDNPSSETEHDQL